MPYAIRKVANKNCYKVINTQTKTVSAKCTTLAKAKKQMRLLYGLEHGMKLRKRK